MLMSLLSLSFVLCGSYQSTSNPAVGCRLELDNSILPAGTHQSAILKLTLETQRPDQPINRPPVNLAIVLDRSGSMQGSKLQNAKQAALAAFRSLAPTDLFALVIYDDRVTTIIPSQPVGEIPNAKALIDSVTAGNSTALFAGVSQAAAEIRRNTARSFIHRILLLSDGLANVGPSSPEDLGRLGAALAKEQITVSTIGVGNDYNEDLMTRLSQSSDGNTYYVESSVDLPRIFQAELGDVFAIVAQNVVAGIEFPSGVKPLELIGREGRISDRKVEVRFNELYASQEKYALVRVEIAEAKPDQTLDVAKAFVNYLDVVQQVPQALAQTLSAQVSADATVVAASTNTAVEQGYYLNRNALAQDQAIDLADKGKVDEAVQTIMSNYAELNQAATQNSDPALAQRAEEMKQLAEQLEKEGVSKKSRKQMRTDSYQLRKQQKQVDLKSDDANEGD